MKKNTPKAQPKAKKPKVIRLDENDNSRLINTAKHFRPGEADAIEAALDRGDVQGAAEGLIEVLRRARRDSR